MAGGGRGAIVMDANSVIDLIKLDVLPVVPKVSGYVFLITEEVTSEIKWDKQRNVLQKIINARLIWRVSLNDIEELKLFSELTTTLDIGEAASLAYARYHNCYILSDENNRAFMREVRRIITEHRLKRTPELLVETIRTRSLSLSDLKRRIDYLRKKVSTQRDADDISHFENVLKEIERML